MSILSIPYYTYLLAISTRDEKGFSQVYIFITCIPEIISFISLTLSSVRVAIFNRNEEVFFPNHPGKSMRQIKYGKTTSLCINCKLWLF